jgi:hypothetical protein
MVDYEARKLVSDAIIIAPQKWGLLRAEVIDFVCTQTKNRIYSKIIYRGWLNLIQIENSGYLNFLVVEGFLNIEPKHSKRYLTNPLLYWYFFFPPYFWVSGLNMQELFYNI